MIIILIHVFRCARCNFIMQKIMLWQAMKKSVWPILLAILLGVWGCSGQQTLLPGFNDAGGDSAAADAEALVAGDPAGPLPEPQLPADLVAAAASRQDPTDDLSQQKAIEYDIDCQSGDVPELAEAFMQSSLLARLKDTPVYSVTALEQRLHASLKEGQDILHSYGYYDGLVRGHLKNAAPGGAAESDGVRPGRTVSADSAILVEVTFTPGPLYRLGKTVVLTTEPLPMTMPAADEGDEEDKRPSLPRSLADVGLKSGVPAKADDVLKSVDLVGDAYHNQGYPFASIHSTRYVLDRSTHELEAEVWVKPGHYTLMGDLEAPDLEQLKLSYLEALRTWKAGQPWNQSRVDKYRDALRQSGLFKSIDLGPAETEDAKGQRAVVAHLKMSPARTLGGALKYDTSFGPGVQAYWEHRNLTERGDRLRLEMPLWADMQELSGKYRLPFFLSNKQDFIAQGGVFHQDTDAYKLQSAAFAAGIERRLSRRWSFTSQASAEGGWLEDPDEPRHNYLMFGLPSSLTYSSANSLLDATRGIRATLGLAPYTGQYDGAFSALRARLDLAGFIPVVGEETLVLAMRGSVGALFGADAAAVPNTVRFYSGGGGSVRGYEYQSLGPRNRHDDPLGGRSLVEVNIETRWKITEEWGLVAFLDGGMVYEKLDFDLGQDMLWGAGLGLRFYTSIGPVRFDVATPVNPRDDDKSLQFYISIGQSF